ncbi:hypothetical protein GS896_25695 [Rhodococcus hoagii]|nr:hypothetical protein [Prescottella equi]MBM4654100.1 hypothetical protein [Prescottella equi]MBM4719574.1 hypothetical protein [Prescottella equi]NKR23373.1 hypothetical protein [Prescottella equi]NKT56016.1 hypothetical protein [Prescottella equi]
MSPRTTDFKIAPEMLAQLASTGRYATVRITVGDDGTVAMQVLPDPD